jgi:hypothetical protein
MRAKRRISRVVYFLISSIGSFAKLLRLSFIERINSASSCVARPLISRARAARTARSDDPTYMAGLEPIHEGMRKAGVPEQ